MRIIVTGDKEFDNYKLFNKKLDYYTSKLTEIVILTRGEKEGPDKLADKWCLSNKKTIINFRPFYKEDGKKAELIRDKTMLNEGEALIVFWDDKSDDVKRLIRMANKRNKPVRIVYY